MKTPPNNFQEELYQMSLHDILHVAGVRILRVPNGWIYDSTFVPYSEEFKPKVARKVKQEIDTLDFEAFKATWNTVVANHTIPKITSLTDARKKALRDVVKQHGKGELLKAMKMTSTSSFLNGKGAKTGSHDDWVCNFDFFIKSANFVKILEGGFKGNLESKPEWIKGKSVI